MSCLYRNSALFDVFIGIAGGAAIAVQLAGYKRFLLLSAKPPPLMIVFPVSPTHPAIAPAAIKAVCWVWWCASAEVARTPVNLIPARRELKLANHFAPDGALYLLTASRFYGLCRMFTLRYHVPAAFAQRLLAGTVHDLR